MSQTNILDNFLISLSERESSNIVYNHYRDKDIRNNLRLYFEYLLLHWNDVLVVGETPGYRGCRLTGIPFASGEIIKKCQHEIFKEIRSKIKLNETSCENTATILWSYLRNHSSVSVFWNAFPFHPHKYGIPESNRKPTTSELEEGKQYLKAVYCLFQPKRLCSLGRIGEAVLRETFPNERIEYIRHPSYGGKKNCIEGLEKILGRIKYRSC